MREGVVDFGSVTHPYIRGSGFRFWEGFVLGIWVQISRELGVSTWSRPYRMRICAGVLLYLPKVLQKIIAGSEDHPHLAATAASLPSDSFTPLVRGEYACSTIPIALHCATISRQLRQGWSSIWFTAGVMVAYDGRA